MPVAHDDRMDSQQHGTRGRGRGSIMSKQVQKAIQLPHGVRERLSEQVGVVNEL